MSHLAELNTREFNNLIESVREFDDIIKKVKYIDHVLTAKANREKKESSKEIAELQRERIQAMTKLEILLQKI